MFSDTYKVVENKDGTYTIKDVPFFQTGDHKGFDFTPEWCDGAIENANKLEQDSNYRSTVFVGHTGKDNPEPEAKGFMSNMVRKDNTLYTDIANISKENIDLFKNKLYPYRSAEASPKGGFFSGLALTSQRPYFKFPALNVEFNQFGEELETVNVDLKVEDQEDELPVIYQTAQKILDRFEEIEAKQSSKREDSMSDETKTVDVEKFEERFASFETKFGEYEAKLQEAQGENASLREELERVRDAAKKDKEAIVASDAKNFTEDLKNGRKAYLKGKAIAPAVLDIAPFSQLAGLNGVSIKFGEGEGEREETVYDAVKNFAEAVIEKAVKGELLVDLDEKAEKSEDRFTQLPVDQDIEDADIQHRDKLIQVKMVELAGGEDKYQEAQKNFSEFSNLRQRAFVELGLD